MKLLEAIGLLNKETSAEATPFPVSLATGFTPLHFETFLQAYLLAGTTQQRPTVQHGFFGDLAGNLERLKGNTDSVAVILEWEDLDARLGVRTLGGWTVETLADILKSSQRQIARVANAIRQIPGPIAFCLPTLPLPPLAYSSPREFSRFESELRGQLAAFVNNSEAPVRFLNPQELDLISPLSERFDLKSSITAGFPYTIGHAERLAKLMAALILPPSPKKGLITDLDDTLWMGILGEAGLDGVSWNLDQGGQINGIYQQFLASLASSGVLVAVASKNDQTLVEKVFELRQDLLLSRKSIFPIDAHWGPKSESVARILKSWNIAADDTVFVDDSPMEIAEVQGAFPKMECIVFPKNSYAGFWSMLHRLREGFGKSNVLEEDAIRLQSLRASSVFQQQDTANGSGIEEFLRDTDAEISFDCSKKPSPRAFELINKTNQFNLNGFRLSEPAWNALLADPNAFLVKMSYKDRYGPLGTVAVLAGSYDSGQLRINHWVMSCRAFSRRIEHRALQWLLDRFPADAITFQFVATDRNGPTQEFLASFLGKQMDADPRLSREEFVKNCPPLFHRVVEEAAS